MNLRAEQIEFLKKQMEMVRTDIVRALILEGKPGKDQLRRMFLLDIALKRFGVKSWLADVMKN